ncbi:hypothetical protein SANA_03480 [Gottschalkiaceae bacterium SANA]|nr:hypothetical protein SANA_03480 [Gottschalkiaceae bacterium SANA]
MLQLPNYIAERNYTLYELGSKPSAINIQNITIDNIKEKVITFSFMFKHYESKKTTC